MNTTNRFRRMAAISGGVVASLLIASSAMAHECVNASKVDQSAGVQIVIDLTTDEVEWTTEGVAKRIEKGVIDPATGEGFHGLIGFDFDGNFADDGVVDVSTWMGVGPGGEEIPAQAQLNGPADKGLTNICLLYPDLCFGE